jgi:hypothetical protein
MMSVRSFSPNFVQSLLHVSLDQTNTVVFVRFVFFCAQIVSFFWLTAIVVTSVSRAA